MSQYTTGYDLQFLIRILSVFGVVEEPSLPLWPVKCCFSYEESKQLSVFRWFTRKTTELLIWEQLKDPNCLPLRLRLWNCEVMNSCFGLTSSAEWNQCDRHRLPVWRLLTVLVKTHHSSENTDWAETRTSHILNHLFLRQHLLLLKPLSHSQVDLRVSLYLSYKDNHAVVLCTRRVRPGAFRLSLTRGGRRSWLIPGDGGCCRS